MHRFIARPLMVIFHAVFLALLAGCQFSPADHASGKPALRSAAAASTHQQLIVKFKSATFRCVPADIARLSAQTNVRLEFVRPMSGDACVIKQVQGDARDFSHGQKLLMQHPSIEWVELDAVMKTM